MSDFADESRPALVIAGGPRNGETVSIDMPGLEKRLGSAPDCHLRFGAGSVDHHHARVAWEADRGIVLYDDGSAAGTWVNGERVTGEHQLQDGDRISLGPPGAGDSIRLLVQVPPQLEAPLVLDAEEPMVIDTSDDFTLAPPAEDDEVFDASQEPFPVVEPAGDWAAPPSAIPPAPAAERGAPPAVPAVILEEGEAAPAPTAPARKPVYTDELPSIAVDRPRESITLPPLVSAAKVRKTGGGVIWAALAAGGTLVLAGGGFFAYRLLHKPRPVVSSAMPARVEPGGSLTITGTGFATEPAANVVAFGSERGSVTAASETQLTVLVPAALAAKGEVEVTVETGGGRSNALRVPLRLAPRPTALEPDVALPGSEVVMRGQNLDGKPVLVTVAGQTAVVSDAQPTSLRFQVPPMEFAEGQGASVMVQAAGEAARPMNLTLGHLPLVQQVEPPRAQIGERVTLRGRGFDPDPAGNEVTFGPETAMVLSASDNQLEVVVPAQPATGNEIRTPLVVRARGAVSVRAAEFTLVRPSSANFVPRFFPARVPQDPARAFVASELGPLLLLSGPDAARSNSERAANVAAALNALFAAGGAPVIEVRQADVPAVAVQGQSQPLVRATAEDAAGYTQPWNAAMKGQRATPAALAAYWSALLQDHLALFVQRQRPTRVIELSPRGKVLLELHAEAERRMGAGGGVPGALVTPPHPALAAALRELALALPPRAQAVPGAALVGRWEGPVEESGLGQRQIRLQLRLQGTKLIGSITTRAGQVSMDVPLKALAYDKGVLTFEVPAGAPRRYRASLSGSVLSGSIVDPAQKEVGRFTLRYIE